MLSFWRGFRKPAQQNNSQFHPNTPMPIIVGAPRSGTTLLRFMLDAHPLVVIPPETGFLTLGLRLKGDENRQRQAFCQTLMNYPENAPAWPDFGLSEVAFREAIAEINPFTISDGYRAFYKLYALRFGKPRWGDKTPLYCLSINEIRKILPEARFIHIIRDGRDAALSLREQWFSPGKGIETQANYWRRCVMTARQAGIGQADYLEIRYEDLILNMSETLSAICRFIELDYDEAMLKYYERSPERLDEHQGRFLTDGTPIVTKAQRLRQQQATTLPPDLTRVYAWKSAMTTAEQKRFEQIAGHLLATLGYEVQQ